MIRILNVVVALLAALLISIGVRWLVDPAGAAEGLGMVLLDGAGRASQIGDGGSFFLGTGTMMLVGVITRRPPLLVAGGVMIGAVALFRVLAWAVHGAAFTAEPIVIEVLTLVTALAAARYGAARA